MILKMKIKQSIISKVTLGIFFFIVVLLCGSIMYMKWSIKHEQTAEKRRTEFKELGISLADASDYLTDEARKFVVTKDITHMNQYWQEINVVKTRDSVITRLKELNAPSAELELLEEAKKNSDALVETEKRSMRLVLEALDIPENNMPPEVAAFHLSSEDEKLNNDGKFTKARDIMFDAKYDKDKKSIMNPIAKFQKIMNTRLETELSIARKAMVKAETLQIILAFIIVCTIAILLRIMFTQLTNPIKNYTERLHNIKFNNKSLRLIPEGLQELRMLAETFNETYNSLQAELIKRKKAEETMKRAKEEAELANRIKSQFLANMSHEIRTPLNAIIGYQYMLKNTQLNFKQREYSKKIEISAKNLLEIINNILDFSKIEAGKLTLESVEFDLYSLLDDIFTIVNFEVQRKELKLKFCVNADVPQYLKGDPTRLKQIILNIISNGVKFTEKGSVNIHVELLKKDKNQVNLQFSVIDTGIGISEEEKKFLFQAFRQGDASTTRKYGGTGLGLAISKELVELMDGKMHVESELGKGSKFSFTTKFETVDKISSAENQYKIKKSIGLFINKKILLVEDNEINMQMTRQILEDLGFDTDIAKNGALAVEMVENKTYDAVLMDIQMPEMDGYEAIYRIRALKGTETLPIIALTADVVEGVAERAKKAGANLYMTKPLNAEKLVDILKSLINIDNSDDEEDSNDVFSEPFEKKVNQQIPIDFESAIIRIGGKKETYRNILELFIQNHVDDSKKLCDFILEEDWEGAKKLVHTMKGIAGNIGAKGLQDVCERIGDAILKSRLTEIGAWGSNFEVAFKEVIDYACQLASTLLNEENTVDKRMKFADSKGILAKLFNLLQIGDYEAKNLFESCKGYLIGELEREDYSKLNEKISSYNFEEAADDLHEIISRIREVGGRVKDV